MNKKILIADDDPNIRLLIEETLSELKDNGVELLLASDGEEAVKLAQMHHPDVIILDIIMPQKTGYEACEEIRNAPNAGEAFIIMLSGRSSEVTLRTTERVGANVYIAKPFEPEQLLSTVEEALYRNKKS